MAEQMLERERELAELQAHLEAALEGDGRVLLIEGPAGVGKTRLLVEARSLAPERGAATLLARASQLERDFPFGVVRQLFEAGLADPGLRERALAGAAAPAQAVFASLPAPGEAEGGADASFAILHGLFWMTLNLAQEQPLVLAIDDLQWCDRPSLRFLTYLARRIEGLPVLAAATVRTGEPPTDEAMMGDIAQDPATVYIRPSPLSHAGVAAVVAERLGDAVEPAFTSACHRTTGGNPLLVRQLITALAAEHVEPLAANAHVVREIGPRAVSRSVLLRLARMPNQTIAAARAVAILGENAELPAVAALAELRDTEAATAIAALARAEILRPEAPLGFVHPLVRDAVYHELPPGERELQHARAARALHDAGAGADQVATHLMAIPRRGDPWVAEILTEAGRSAMRRGATESAVAYLQRALDEPPADEARPALLFELGLTEALTNGPASVEHLTAAYELAPAPELKAMGAYALARVLLFSASPSEGVSFARQAHDEIDPSFTDVRRSLQAIEAIGYYFGVSDDTTLKELERYRDESPGDGPGARMLDSMAAIDLFQQNGPVEETLRLARRSLADGTLIEYDNGLFNIPAVIALTYGDSPDTRSFWDEAVADAYRRGSLFGKSAADGWLGFSLFHMGELEEAKQFLGAAYESLISYGYAPSIHTYFSSFHSRAVLESGDVAAARRALEHSVDPCDHSDGSRYWLRAEIELLLAENKPEEALAASHELERRHRPRIVNPTCWPYRSLRARALARLDRRDEAVELVEEELVLARAYGAPGILTRTLRVLGQVKGDEAGIDDLAAAVEMSERSHARLERARALAAYGGALRRTRHPSDAREPLRLALELAEALGATALAEQTRTELYATGARPRSDAVSGVGSLTASERRVADLAAEGASNRDIAQALYVTPKTVEVHLSNAYRKLGIRSRRELPNVLVASA